MQINHINLFAHHLSNWICTFVALLQYLHYSKPFHLFLSFFLLNDWILPKRIAFFKFVNIEFRRKNFYPDLSRDLRRMFCSARSVLVQILMIFSSGNFNFLKLSLWQKLIFLFTVINIFYVLYCITCMIKGIESFPQTLIF